MKMGSLARLRLPQLSARLVRFLSSEESPWLLDNKPGPYPKTEEEKCKAAKKYGMLREEYEPYDDDGEGFGDYPKLTTENIEERDPFYPYSHSYFRRNHGEVIPLDGLFYSYERLTAEKPRQSFLVAFGSFSLAIGVVAVLLFAPKLKDLKYHHPILEKQYFNSEEVHYTFELEQDGSKLINH